MQQTRSVASAGAKPGAFALGEGRDGCGALGGHAKRNEFRVGDRLLIGYGGYRNPRDPNANTLFDQQPAGPPPYEIGRMRCGSVTIANSDAPDGGSLCNAKYALISPARKRVSMNLQIRSVSGTISRACGPLSSTGRSREHEQDHG